MLSRGRAALSTASAADGVLQYMPLQFFRLISSYKLRYPCLGGHHQSAGVDAGLVRAALKVLVPTIVGDGGGSRASDDLDDLLEVAILEAIPELLAQISQVIQVQLVLALNVKQREGSRTTFFGVWGTLT